LILTQNLGVTFSVVQKARQNERLGATRAIAAAYPRGPPFRASQADIALERLTLPAALASPPTVHVAEPADAVDHKKLEELTRHHEEPPPAPVARTPDQKAELEKANQKLSSIGRMMQRLKAAVWLTSKAIPRG
jgi:hypothetical protein